MNSRRKHPTTLRSPAGKGSSTVKDKRPDRLALIVGCICGLAWSHIALAKTVFSDSEFDVDNDWTIHGPYVVPQETMGAGLAARHVDNDGNPGAYMEVTITRGSVDSGETVTWGALINDQLVWDPAQGAIGSLDMQLDVDERGAWTLAVQQGEYVWMALRRRVVDQGTGWTHHDIGCLSEEDFVTLPGSEFVIEDQPPNPDFSVDAPPIAFGIGTGLSCPTTSNCTQPTPAIFKLDNFSVSVHAPLTINAGLNDAWYSPATAGQGFFNVVYPGINLVFLSWFTYDTERPPEDVTAILGEPGHRWLTAQGGYEGDTADLEIGLTAGGVFDMAEPAPDPAVPIGTMTIHWCDCEKGMVDYSLPDLGLQGVIDIQRIANDNVPLCEALLDEL